MANKYYIKSDNVEVFPSGFRGPAYINSKLTTEDYIRSLRTISSHSENNNFFIGDPYDVNCLIISIRGYLFRLNLSYLTSLLLNETNVWAYITLRTISSVGTVLANSQDGAQSQLDTIIDNVECFTGIVFSDSDPTQFETPIDSKNVLKIKTGGHYTYQYSRLSTDEIRNGYNNSTLPAISKEFTTEKLNVETTTIDSNGIVSDSLKITSNLPNFEVSLTNGTVKANNVGTFADPIGSIYSSSISTTNLYVSNELLGNKANFTKSVITSNLGSTTSKVSNAYINNAYIDYIDSVTILDDCKPTKGLTLDDLTVTDDYYVNITETGIYLVSVKYNNKEYIGTVSITDLNVDSEDRVIIDFILGGEGLNSWIETVKSIKFTYDKTAHHIKANYYTNNSSSGQLVINHCKKLIKY